jgi:hypothetical protein
VEHDGGRGSLSGKRKNEILKVSLRRREKKGMMAVNNATTAGADDIICSNKMASENEVDMTNITDDVTSVETMVFIRVEQLDAIDRTLDRWKEPVHVRESTSRSQISNIVSAAIQRIRERCVAFDHAIEFRNMEERVTATDDIIADCVFDLGCRRETTAFMVGFYPIVAW